MIVDATDGGIVIFGSPDSTIRNNHISVKTVSLTLLALGADEPQRTMLGGINCLSSGVSRCGFTDGAVVDVLPWRPLGNYTDVFVENNTILGGFATSVSPRHAS